MAKTAAEAIAESMGDYAAYVAARHAIERQEHPYKPGPFHLALEAAGVLARVRANDADAMALYSSLCNNDWFGPNGESFGCTWRASGSFVAELRGENEDAMAYCKYYIGFEGTEGTVAPWITDAMASVGWTWKAMS